MIKNAPKYISQPMHCTVRQGFEDKTFSTGRNEFPHLELTETAFDALGLPAEIRAGYVGLLVRPCNSVPT